MNNQKWKKDRKYFWIHGLRKKERKKERNTKSWPDKRNIKNKSIKDNFGIDKLRKKEFKSFWVDESRENKRKKKRQDRWRDKES